MSGRMREICNRGKIKTFWKMEPYCGYKTARKSPIRFSRIGAGSNCHRPKGIAKIERRATLKALKSSARQKARRIIINFLRNYK